MIKLMLIDDHPVVRAGLRAILESFEDVTVLAEGSDGTAALADQRPGGVDVVVMDLQMPGMGGLEATRALAEEAQQTGSAPPVLILTTYDSQADILAAVSAGAVGYLLKDAAEDRLHEAVQAAARGDHAFSSRVSQVLISRAQQPADTQLSARELQILQALTTGESNRDIARSLFISQATVKTHLVHIYQKLGVDNRTQAIAVAREQRLV
ncbi:response regulator transcription factor [Auritidibacter ignavus]|uniref:response regulator transcription factor n=1 Tax=Auritidibacter ignavus TaxID=678932 RepID=UPI002FE69036